jgi:hypothetical protein
MPTAATKVKATRVDHVNRCAAMELAKKLERYWHERGYYCARLWARRTEEMNVLEKLADDMLRINPEHMRVLSENELTEYGPVAANLVDQEAVEVQEAKALGLERKEYMRRKLLVERGCGGSPSSYVECRSNILETGSVPQLDFSQYGRPTGGQ